MENPFSQFLLHLSLLVKPSLKLSQAEVASALSQSHPILNKYMDGESQVNDFSCVNANQV